MCINRAVQEISKTFLVKNSLAFVCRIPLVDIFMTVFRY